MWGVVDYISEKKRVGFCHNENMVRFIFNTNYGGVEGVEIGDVLEFSVQKENREPRTFPDGTVERIVDCAKRPNIIGKHFVPKPSERFVKEPLEPSQPLEETWASQI
jgi:hypothetical protein